MRSGLVVVALALLTAAAPAEAAKLSVSAPRGGKVQVKLRGARGKRVRFASALTEPRTVRYEGACARA